MPIQMRKAWTEGMFILPQINTTAQFPHRLTLQQFTMGLRRAPAQQPQTW